MSAATVSSSMSTSIDSLQAPAASIIARKPAQCRYFMRGICRYGSMCRFSHEIDCDVSNISNGCSNTASGAASNVAPATANDDASDQPKPSTSRSNWANAPVFVPKQFRTAAKLQELAAPVDNAAEDEGATAVYSANKTWAEVAGGGGNNAVAGVLRVSETPGSVDMICPYEGPCPYGAYCSYAIHLELCHMCDQFCLNPIDQAQRHKHNKECLQQHEQAMELSFAIARSKDKTCGICFDTIMEKSGREKRFGILPNCNHIFCLECIRKWRQAKQFEHKITRSCPECRVSSDFVCPSAFWVETKDEKDKLLSDYRSALNDKDCKYFKKGDGKCPFGNKCFYKHALPNGKLVDVGCPKKARKLMRQTNEIIDLLDIYLWEFVEQRDWLDFITLTSDDSDYSDYSEDDD